MGRAFLWGTSQIGKMSAVPYEIRHPRKKIHFLRIEVGNFKVVLLSKSGCVYKLNRLGKMNELEQLNIDFNINIKVSTNFIITLTSINLPIFH